MVQRGDRHRWQDIDPPEHVVVSRQQRTELQRRGDQDRAVEADAGRLLQQPDETADPVSAVALTGDEHGEPHRPWTESHRPMNSHSDSRSRL